MPKKTKSVHIAKLENQKLVMLSKDTLANSIRFEAAKLTHMDQLADAEPGVYNVTSSYSFFGLIRRSTLSRLPKVI